MATIIAKNLTASPITLSNLDGVTIPASGTLNLSTNNKLHAIRNDPQLLSLINAGTIVLNDGVADLTLQQSLTALGQGEFPKKVNFAATAAPAVGNDKTQGYEVGSLWIDTTNDVSFVCVDDATGAAVWKKTGLALTAQVIADTQAVSADALTQTTSGSFVDIPGMTLTTVNAGGNNIYVVMFAAEVQTSNPNRVITIRIMINGVADATSQRSQTMTSSGSAATTTTFAWKANVGNGQVIKVQWQVSSNTADMRGRTLIIQGSQ